MKKTSGETPVVMTVGHSNRPWIDFLEILRAHRVQRIVDVRFIPQSRRNPQFNKTALPAALRAAKIGYAHIQALGGLRRAQSDSPNTGWRNASFRGYADYMQTSEFQAALERLMTLARRKRTAIMCAEAVPWRCHRSLIADALTVRGIKVENILSKKSAQAHLLTPFASVRGERITYPG